MNTLTRLEKWAEHLIEKPFGRLFKPHLHPADLTRALALAMEEGHVVDSEGKCYVPNYYNVTLNVADYKRLQNEVVLDEEIEGIKRYLLGLMAETKCYTTGTLQISIKSKKDVKSGKVNITTHYLKPKMANNITNNTDNNSNTMVNSGEDTKQIEKSDAKQWWLQLPNRDVQLGLVSLKIGRSLDNDVILSDETVSRHHAHLYWQKGVYYIKNTSQTQALSLNHKTITNPVALKTGDRLQLGLCVIHVKQIV